MRISKSFLSIAAVFLLTAGSTVPISAETVNFQSSNSASTVADASDHNRQVTKKIGEYDCWSVDGEYYTTLNSEIYHVINLDELNWEYDEVATQAASNNWQNGKEVDISKGKAYHGSVDISKSDFNTPIFIGYTDQSQKNHVSYCFNTGFIFTNKYKVSIHQYNPVNKTWSVTNTTFAFNMTGQTKTLFSGTTAISPSKICFTFYNSGSTGEKVFNYSFYSIQS